MKIIINSIQCKHCGTVLESHSTHEFKFCSCGRVAIDGGTEYLKRIGFPSDFIDLSILEDEEE